MNSQLPRRSDYERPQPLSAREGGKSISPRHEGLPTHLAAPIREWARNYIESSTELRIALLLEVALSPKGRIRSTTAPPSRLVDHPDVDLLDVVDLALQLQGSVTHCLVNPETVVHDKGPQALEVESISTKPLRQLERLLGDGGSVYRVDLDVSPPRLMRRVDPVTQAAFDLAVSDTDAGQLLRRAWHRVYSREINPDGAYLDAVRAVETLICPLILPRNPKATLSTAIKHLRDAPAKWELTLAEAGDRNVEPLVAMLDRLWHGNLESRHGSLNYREVNLQEARAAVQLAVVLVQWVSDRVIYPTPTTT
ncbi:hypothetical protein [Pseudonocardia sp. ICBG1034]|uniref:hypothetical protein n=1 Tax=Pseudonocardia sp. ICBG1034 TaxID=2844381 RepID=UPI001CC98F4D|nr:hypothetical protein [Pseudonocardia sp. ICBG1034]